MTAVLLKLPEQTSWKPPAPDPYTLALIQEEAAKKAAKEAAKTLTQKLSEWWEVQWYGGGGPPVGLLWAVPLALGAVYFLWPRKRKRTRRPGQFFKTPLEPRPGGGYRMKYED